MMGRMNIELGFPCGFKLKLEQSAWNLLGNADLHSAFFQDNYHKIECPLHGKKCGEM